MNIGKVNDIEYLKEGNDKQKKSYRILKEKRIMDKLKGYDPILAGTIPLGIDTENSDLDIICKVDNFSDFKEVVMDLFSKERDFKICIKDECVVCNFIIEDMEIEIYTSKINSEKSYGVRHMVIEDRIMNLAGERFKEEVISLKKAGIKTEPAFAKVLGIEGCPYEGILKFEGYSDEEIKKIIRK